jgi:hypothetical protein
MLQSAPVHPVVQTHWPLLQKPPFWHAGEQVGEPAMHDDAIQTGPGEGPPKLEGAAGMLEMAHSPVQV